MAYIGPSTGDFLRVSDWSYYPHQRSPDRPPCLCLVYETDRGTIREFLPVEHSGSMMRATVARAWAELGGDRPAPFGIDEALARADELSVHEIEVTKDDRYWRVVSHRRRPSLTTAIAATITSTATAIDDDALEHFILDSVNAGSPAVSGLDRLHAAWNLASAAERREFLVHTFRTAPAIDAGAGLVPAMPAPRERVHA